MKDKEWVVNLEKKAFKFFNCKAIWILLFVLTCVSLVVDFLPTYSIVLFLKNECGIDILDVYNHVVKVFDYDMGVFVSILTVIWAFMVGFSSIFFDKMESKCFGIRVLDIIEHNRLITNLVAIVVIAVGELVLIMLGVFFNLKLTMCINSMLLLNTMIVLFLFVVIYFSRSVIIEMVIEEVNVMLKEQKGLSDTSLFKKLIDNLDYGSKEDVQELKRILNKIGQHGKSDIIDGSYNKTDIYIKELVYDITFEILDNIGKNSERKNVIEYWFGETNSSAMQVGILYAFLDRETKEDFELALSITRCLSEKRCRELSILMLLYELENSIYHKSEWRRQNAVIIFKQYLQSLSQEEVLLWHKLWKCICKDMGDWQISYRFLDKMKVKREYT